MNPRKLFVAGATGATGRVLVRLAEQRGLPLVSHVRTRHAKSLGLPASAAVFELSDAAALDSALTGCTTVLQLIGTMRERFRSGDTYATSDVGTTRLLVEAAKRAGVDHFLLLSSVGAGRPVGAYLQAKAQAEELVTGSGLPFTVFRPSALEGDGRKPPRFLGALTRALGLRSLVPITLEALSSALLDVAEARSPLGAVLEGKSLWAQVSRKQPSS